MFFSAKYARALGKLGLSGPLIERSESDVMLRHGDFHKKMGATPIEAAVSYFTTVIDIKINSAPNVYVPVAIAAQAQILEWVTAGKLTAEAGNEAILRIINSFPSSEEPEDLNRPCTYSNSEPTQMLMTAKPTASAESEQRMITQTTVEGIEPYMLKPGEEYMNKKQLKHFRNILLSWKGELSKLEDKSKLVEKIDEAIDKIDHEEYGYCESCGVELGVRRLEARPTATLCIDCKTLDEIRVGHGLS